MNLPQEDKDYLKIAADETLDQFETVASAARKELRALVPGYDVLASVNTLTSGPAMRRLEQSISINRESYRILTKEPAIARVVVADENGQQHTYYICRATPPSGFENLASYRAPVGHFATLPIGAEFSLPGKGTVEVIEQVQ